MLPETLERRFNGPVPRTLALGAVVDEAVLCRRQAAARVRTLMRMAARAPAGITCLRRFGSPCHAGARTRGGAACMGSRRG